MILNLYDYIWNNKESLAIKLNYLYEIKNKLDKEITNNKKLPFDIYYDFTKDLFSEVCNKQWKEVVLGIQVLKIIKRWDKKYTINLKKKMPGSFFIEYFKNTIFDSEHSLLDIGINYRKPKYTLKTFIIWSDKLARDKIISNRKYNMFMCKLEEISI